MGRTQVEQSSSPAGVLPFSIDPCSKCLVKGDTHWGIHSSHTRYPSQVSSVGIS